MTLLCFLIAPTSDLGSSFKSMHSRVLRLIGPCGFVSHHPNTLVNSASALPSSAPRGGCFLLAYLFLRSSHRNRSLFILGQLYIAKCDKFGNTGRKMFYLLMLSRASLLLLFSSRSPCSAGSADPPLLTSSPSVVRRNHRASKEVAVEALCFALTIASRICAKHQRWPTCLISWQDKCFSLGSPERSLGDMQAIYQVIPRDMGRIA